MDKERPDLVYGLVPLHGGSLAVAEKHLAVALADEIDDVKGCATYGALRAVAARLRHTDPPCGRPGLNSQPSDAAFDWRTSIGWLDRTWPPLASFLIYLIDDDRLRQVVIDVTDAVAEGEDSHTVGLPIDESKEAELVGALLGLGYSATRDDALLRRLAWADVPSGPAQDDERREADVLPFHSRRR